MKILHVYKSFFPETSGGVEKAILQIYKNSKKINIENELFILGKQKKIYRKYSFQGLKIHSIKKNFTISSCPFSLHAFMYFKKISKNFDIILFHYPWPFMDLLAINKNKNCKYILYYHSDIIKQKILLVFYYFLRKMFFKVQDIILFSSKRYYNSSPFLKNLKNKKIQINLSLDENDYKINKKQILRYKKKYGKNFILFVGVIRNYKGIDELIKAAKFTKNKIIIAGYSQLISQYKKICKIKKIKNVDFIGKVSEKKKIALLKLCLCTILPSIKRSEAFGLFLIESCIFRKPMISTNLGTATSYINIHKKTGFVAKPKDPIALTKYMNYFTRNPEIAKKMGENAYYRYKSKFNNKPMLKFLNKLK